MLCGDGGHYAPGGLAGLHAAAVHVAAATLQACDSGGSDVLALVDDSSAVQDDLAVAAQLEVDAHVLGGTHAHGPHHVVEQRGGVGGGGGAASRGSLARLVAP